MATTSIVLGFLSFSILALGTYWTVVNYKRAQNNKKIARELDDIVELTLSAVKETRDAALKQEQLDNHDITSPAMLSSILTVIVSKYGNINLSLDDFLIPDGEYVSVYVDTTSKELILSLSHQVVTPDELYSIISFTDSDDNTFH